MMFSQCEAFPTPVYTLHPHTQRHTKLQLAYSPALQQSFRWLIRSVICLPSDITVPAPSPHPSRDGQVRGVDLVTGGKTQERSVRSMAAGTAEGDVHMEELVDQDLGMEETDDGQLRRPSLKENYHSDSLLAPDGDFITGLPIFSFPDHMQVVGVHLPCVFTIEVNAIFYIYY